MRIKDFIFPQQSREFKGQRWVNILFRSLHLIGIAGVGGAFLFNVTNQQWLPYMFVTVVSGSAMVILEVWSNGIWLIQLRGLATLLKLSLLSLTFIFGMQAMILFSVIFISGLMSHAPGKVRYYSFIRLNN